MPTGGFTAELEQFSSYAYYAATRDKIYMAAGDGAGTFNSVSTALSEAAPVSKCSFAQYEDLVYAARGVDGVLVHTAGSSSNFTTVPGLTGTRDGRYLFVVGQFLVVANLGSSTARPSALQWSAIDNTSNFPTPNSATAIATQSGEQVLNFSDGPIVGGYGGDQYGIVVQTGAITRMTYIGPPAVFQFDRIDAAKGQQRRYGGAHSGQLAYFQSSDGFWRTDGVSNASIGDGRVNKTFIDSAADDIGVGATTLGAMMDCAFHHVDKHIYWSFAVGSTSNANKLYIYSTHEDRWSSANQVMRTFVEPSPSCQSDGLYAFNSSNVLCKFAGTAGTAVLETCDAEYVPGGRTFVDGVKQNVESSGTAPAMTTRIGYRDSLNSSPTYTSATSANSATGFADFRIDAKYVRVENTITGNFKKTTGFVPNWQPSSGR